MTPVKETSRKTNERGRNVAVLFCINASENKFISPLFVFPKVRTDNNLKKNAPSGISFNLQLIRLLLKDSVLKWLQIFAERVSLNEKKKKTVVDGHSSHKDLDVKTIISTCLLASTYFTQASAAG